MMPAPHTPWTEMRVTILRNLWAEGLSASQIAGRLGGTSRNAVIGKVHRLGLAGRATTSRRRNRIAHLPLRPTRVLRCKNQGNTALKPVFVPEERPAVALTVVPSVVREMEVPAVLRVDLLDLRECMCRWPIGDPQDESFHFCGRNKGNGISYCDHHAQVAFQPASRRRR